MTRSLLSCQHARNAFLIIVVTVLHALRGTAAAEPKSDVLQPDFFGTQGALSRRTPGLIDPYEQRCSLPASDLTISAAVDLALCRNPTTRSAWAAAHQQAAALGASESAWLPDISVTGGESRALGRHVDTTGAIDSTPQDTADAAISLSWTLYDFGARGGRIHSARHLLDAAAAAASNVSQQTIFSVVQAYYGVVAADQLSGAAQTTQTTASGSLDAARVLRDGGVATLADVLQAETAYDQAVLSRVQAERAARSARGGLAAELGLSADQPLKLTAQAVPAQVPELSGRLAELMAEAARQRPDLVAAQAQLDAAVSDITVARAAGRPSVSLSAGRNWINTTGVAVQSYGVVGLSVTIPIFTGFNVGYGVRQAQAELQIREANLEQIRLNVSLDVWNAYYALVSANQQLIETAKLTQAAASNQDVALGRYQSGVGTILDLLTAQTANANARQFRIEAELGWQVARAQLALALGRLSSAQPLSLDATRP
jgi:outer membrane protein